MLLYSVSCVLVGSNQGAGNVTLKGWPLTVRICLDAIRYCYFIVSIIMTAYIGYSTANSNSATKRNGNKCLNLFEILQE